MKLKSYQWMLILIFMAVFLARASIFTQTDLFSDDSSYFALRQIENIKDTGKPILNDDLSYGGRIFLFSPAFYYILALFYLVIPKAVFLKLILNLAASTIVFATYLLSFELTKKKRISLLTAAASGFIPIYFQETVNSLSIYSIILPLMFYSLYYLMKLKKDKKYSNHFITSMFFLIIISPTSIILILGLLFYLLLARLEKLKIQKSMIEIILVSTFLYLWFNFLFFKNAILFHGQRIIWQNIPQSLLLNYFNEINLIQAVYLIGILPFLLGTYAAYKRLEHQKTTNNYMIIGIAFSLFILLWFKLLELKAGLIFLGATLTILLALFFKLFFDYTDKTIISKHQKLFYFGFTLLIILTSIIPSIALGVQTLDNTPKQETLNAYEWIKQNTEDKVTVLASQNQGHALTYFTKRKNVMDNHYLFINKIDQRTFDVRRMYITRFSQEAIELLQKYSIDYILVDYDVKKSYEVEELYYENSECFEKVYDNKEVKIYEVKCDEEA